MSSPLWDLMQLVDESGDIAFDFVASEPDAVVTDFDPGFPDPRAVTNDRANANGAINTTQFHSSRGITMTVSLDPAKPEQSLSWQKRLLELCMPERRPWLYLRTSNDETVWRTQLVGAAVSAAFQVVLAPQLSWVAPDGLWEATEESDWTIFPGGATGTGWVLPAAFPINFGSGSPAGSVTVRVAGTRPTPPKVRIFGPVTAPGITNTATGDTITFVAGFTIPAGGYVSIDMVNGTILANDDPALTRMNSVNWTISDFWSLLPGDNQISFTGTGLSAVTQAEISWRERAAST